MLHILLCSVAVSLMQFAQRVMLRYQVYTRSHTHSLIHSFIYLLSK